MVGFFWGVTISYITEISQSKVALFINFWTLFCIFFVSVVTYRFFKNGDTLIDTEQNLVVTPKQAKDIAEAVNTFKK